MRDVGEVGVRQRLDIDALGIKISKGSAVDDDVIGDADGLRADCGALGKVDTDIAVG